MEHKVLDISKKLGTLLSEFSGAQGETEKEREKSLMPAFQQIAGKLLYGGHFAVTDKNGDVIRNVYLHSIEFYYHEEGDGLVKDYIVYHRNPDNPAYRASALVRAFRVEVVKETAGVPFSVEVDERSTYFYNALLMGVNVLDGKLLVQWIDNNVQHCVIPHTEPRHNVGLFDEKIHKKGYKYHVKKEIFEQDERPWAFRRTASAPM